MKSKPVADFGLPEPSWGELILQAVIAVSCLVALVAMAYFAFYYILR